MVRKLSIEEYEKSQGVKRENPESARLERPKPKKPSFKGLKISFNLPKGVEEELEQEGVDSAMVLKIFAVLFLVIVSSLIFGSWSFKWFFFGGIAWGVYQLYKKGIISLE